MLTRPPWSGFVCRSCRRSLRQRQQGSTATRNISQKRYKSSQRQLTRKILPDGPVRTRFAPSPTGYLHLGSLRTALFNYLLAKRTGGQFLLRIEDTDQKRTVADAEQRLYEDLRWAGLEWDEGPEVGGPYGPYRQSERTALYREHADKLLESGHAYRCFCSAERLNELAVQRAKLGLSSAYDRTCESIPKEQSDDRATKNESFVVRLKTPDRLPELWDIVYGRVGKDNVKSQGQRDYVGDHPILLKTDGLPTYHLANVVDDHHMKITHVVRGTEWMIATPKHLAMYEAFGWEPPQFAHVGLLQEKDGTKLSKRKGDRDIASFRDWGFLPESMVNFVALLGWAIKPGSSEFLTMEDLESTFDMKWTKGNASVDLKKLDHFQKLHLKPIIESAGDSFIQLVDAVVNEIEKTATTDLDDILKGRDLHDYVVAILRADAKNYVTPGPYVAQRDYMFHALEPSSDSVRETLSKMPIWSLDYLKQLRYELETVPEEGWHESRLHDLISDCIKQVAESDELKQTVQRKTNVDGVQDATEPNDDSKRTTSWATKTVYGFLRAAIAGGKHGMPLASVMEILGKEESVLRLSGFFALTDEQKPGLDFTVSDV